MTIINEVVSFLNHLIWGKLLIYLLLAAGLYFTLATRFLQIRHFTHIFTVMRHSRRGDKSGISSFQALCTSLASRVGTGNLAGVAIAMYLGGPGAIFWMWVTAGIGMATAFIESTLAQVYKVKDDSGHYRGGPAYYMTMGLRARWLGTLFSLCLILAYGFAFNGVQANSISESLALTFSLPHWITGIIVTLLSGLIIFGGLRGISRFAEWAVPIMAGIYLLVALGIIALNINQLPHILSTIVHSAFGLAQAGGGAAGYLLTLAMTNGIKRGLFSNEAGMGSAPNIAASASTYPPHPATQGYVQMLGPFLDTIVICTCTAAIIMLSGQLSPGSGITGVALTQRALVHEVGHWANLFLSVAIFLFAFTTIVGNYAYAENNLFFLKFAKPHLLFGFRCLVLIIVFIGSVGDLPTVWAMADLSMGLMALLNLAAILLLSGLALRVLKDYESQLQHHHVPTFTANTLPELHRHIAPGVWGKPDSPQGSMKADAH